MLLELLKIMEYKCEGTPVMYQVPSLHGVGMRTMEPTLPFWYPYASNRQYLIFEPGMSIYLFISFGCGIGTILYLWLHFSWLDDNGLNVSANTDRS